MKKVLIIAPHPDDEVLGCGGTISFLSSLGYSPHLCIVTKTYTPDWTEAFAKKRLQEIKKSSQVLGIKKFYFLDLPTVKLDKIPQKELNDKLFSIVKKVKPEIILLPHRGDLNLDHRLVAEAGLVACRPFNNKIRLVLAYETLSETEWGMADMPFVPNFYCEVTKTLKKKISAMRYYASENKKSPHPRSTNVIKALAAKRGSEICVKYAEAFVVIRGIISKSKHI